MKTTRGKNTAGFSVPDSRDRRCGWSLATQTGCADVVRLRFGRDGRRIVIPRRGWNAVTEFAPPGGLSTPNARRDR